MSTKEQLQKIVRSGLGAFSGMIYNSLQEEIKSDEPLRDSVIDKHIEAALRIKERVVTLSEE